MSQQSRQSQKNRREAIERFGSPSLPGVVVDLANTRTTMATAGWGAPDAPGVRRTDRPQWVNEVEAHNIRKSEAATARRRKGQAGFTGTEAMTTTAAVGLGAIGGRLLRTRYPDGVQVFGQTVPVALPLGAGGVALGIVAARCGYRQIGRALAVGGVSAAVVASLPVKTT